MQLRHRQSSTVARPVAPKGERAVQRPVEKPVEFTLNQPQARAVAVAGSFNDWDGTRTPLSLHHARNLEGDGLAASGTLPGSRFVVDGQWISDADARGTRSRTAWATTNSVLVA